MVLLVIFGGEQGIFPRLSPLSPRFARWHVGKNSPPDCFLPLRSLLVRIPYSFHIKNNKQHAMVLLVIFGGEQGIFPRLSPLSPRFARWHVGKNSPPDCFLPLRSLLVRIPYSFHIKNNKQHAMVLLVIFGGEQGIRTLEQVIARYTISNRAPSASSDNSPNKLPAYYNLLK